MANEKRLIDANKAQAVLVNMAEHLLEAGNPEMAGAVGYAAEVIGKQKTVDAVPVVNGRWNTEKCDHVPWRIKNPEKWVIYKCSVCGYSNGRKNSNYCPNCGAKMDGDGDG